MSERRLKHRLAKLRRAVTTDDGQTWSAWVEVMYAEPFGTPRYGIRLHPTAGKSFIIGNGRTVRQALRDAERNVKEHPHFSDWERIKEEKERAFA